MSENRLPFHTTHLDLPFTKIYLIEHGEDGEAWLVDHSDHRSAQTRQIAKRSEHNLTARGVKSTGGLVEEKSRWICLDMY